MKSTLSALAECVPPRIFTILFLVSWWLYAASAGAIENHFFDSRLDYFTPLRPHDVTTADFNGDGWPDMALSIRIADIVQLFLNNGDGSYTPAATLEATGDPMALASADFDGDFDPDLVVVCRTDSSVRTYKNVGGSFTANPRLRVQAEPYGLTCADLTGDGLPELITANTADPAGRSGNLAVFTNLGSGSFSQPDYHVAGDLPHIPVAADLNGDTLADLAVTNSGSGDVSIFINLGGGALAEGVEYPVGEGPEGIATVDLDGDSDLDLAVVCVESNELVCLRNDDGIFTPLLVMQVGDEPIDVAGTLLNSDALPDILLLHSQDATACTLFNDGAGGFIFGDCYTTGDAATGMACLDLDGDADIDLVTVAEMSAIVSTHFNRGDGSFEQMTTIVTGANPVGILSHDLNGDGWLDLAATSRNEDTVVVLLGRGDGTFDEPTAYTVGGGAGDLAAADIDGDGLVDLAVTLNTGDAVAVLINDGAGGFSNGSMTTVADYPLRIACGDFNGDAAIDLAVTNQTDHLLSVLFNNGIGAFSPPVEYDVQNDPYDVVCADFNGDMLPDLVVSVPGSCPAPDQRIFIFINNGHGDFIIDFTAVPDIGPRGMAVGDLDGDGDHDVAVALGGVGCCFFGEHLYVLRNHGNGTFAPAENYPAGVHAYAVEITDIDSDSYPDLVVGNGSAKDISVYLNQGAGSFFEEPFKYGVRAFPTDLTCGDFQLDGHPDVAVIDGMRDSISLLFNQATLLPTPSPALTVLPSPTTVPGSHTPRPTATITMTPTPSPSATARPTDLPTTTATASPAATTTPPSPSPTPLVTATPPRSPTPFFSMHLDMPAAVFEPGDTCWLKLLLHNESGAMLHNVRLFIFLDMGIGHYWFWPTWAQYPPEVDSLLTDINEGMTEHEVIQPFTWPEGCGAADHLLFWAGITDQDMTALLHGPCYRAFSYHD